MSNGELFEYIEALKIPKESIAEYNNKYIKQCTKYDIGKEVFIRTLFGLSDEGIQKEFFLTNNPFVGKSELLKLEVRDVTRDVLSIKQYQDLKNNIMDGK